MRILSLIMVMYYILLYITAKQADNYGKFNLRLDKFEICKGPKRKDCSDIIIEILNDTAVNYNLSLKRPTKIIKGKIVANTNNSDFLRLQMKDPCKHMFMKPFLQAALNITRNCVVNPGTYDLVVDIAKVAESYYGGMFLFGTFMFKTFFLSEDCNFSCTNVVVTFLPQKA